MEATNRYMVWTEQGAGEFIRADLVVTLLDTVSFYRNGKEVKSYNRKEFLKNNPNWVEVENDE